MRRNQGRRPVRYTVALVGDGFTESIYFSDFRDTERPDQLQIVPDFPGRIGSFAGVLKRAIELKETYDRVYAMVDMDAIIAQQQLQIYQQQKIITQNAGVIVLENNPCFEIWLLLHFERTGRLFMNCNQVVTALRQHIPGYNKGLRFIEAARLYSTLKPNLPQAINNAKLLENNREDHDLLFPRAGIFEFFEWYQNR